MPVAWWAPPEDDEASAVPAWAQAHGIALVDLASARELGAAPLVWVHAGTRVPVLPTAVQAAMAQHLARGGTLALTLLATPLAQALGAPAPSPVTVPPARWRHDDDPRWPEAFREWPGYPHIRGVQGWGDHPLFRGLVRGTYSWMAREGDLVSRTEFRRPVWPVGGVIGVDRSYVHLDADVAVAWEYEVGPGTIRCLGAHVCLTSGDPTLHPQRDTLLRNLLSPDWGRTAKPWWPGMPWQHGRVSPLPAPRPLEPFPEVVSVGPVARTSGDQGSPITLGSPHGVMTGSARDGVRELWLHPLCLVDGGITLASTGGDLRPESTEVSACSFRRWLRDESGGEWRETLVGGADAASWWYEVAPIGITEHAVAAECRIPLRLAWPMPATLLHPLRTEQRRQHDQATVLVTGCDGQHRVCMTCDGVDDLVLAPDDAAPRLRVIGAPGQGVRLAFRATSGAPFTTLAGTTSVVSHARQRVEGVLGRSLRWHDEGAVFDEAVAWARVRLANFLTTTLDGRRGMMAGYAATRPGWNESRPGYAWFFGRDTCWCVDALLPLGMFEEARTAIDLLAATADVTGKVAHEVSTSGVAHYDAADATPLFVRAVGRYAAWTGDEETVRRWWPAVRRAIAFVGACDRDDDGLPENDRVGHGWIEMGPLGGGSVTSYTAACWVDALRAITPAAARVDPGHMPSIQRVERRATAALDRLRLPGGRLALHRDSSGRLEPEVTALAAVPIALGVDDSSSCGDVLRELATPRFQAPWGLRLLPVDSAWYAPRGYHAGAVWPLFTGWAAWADTFVGERDRAIGRLAAIARLVTQRNLGAFDEVLDGDTGAAAGVCSDQAWSAAALVAPMMHGVLGLAPSPWGTRCGLRARLPRSLGALRLEAIRTGGTRWSARWEAGTLFLRHLGGPALQVHLADVDRQVILGAGPGAVADATIDVGGG
jgi:hypothetical protein